MTRAFGFALCLALGLLPAPGLRAQELGSDPLGDISLDMQLVIGDLTKMATGKTTQETQKEIVNKLDLLIAALEKE